MADRGFTDQLKGKAKEVIGEVTGDDRIKAKGLAEQVIGKAKEVAADVKDAMEDVADMTRVIVNKE